MSLIDDKFIECYVILTLHEGVANQTIREAMDKVKVPEKYKGAVEIEVAKHTIEVLNNGI